MCITLAVGEGGSNRRADSKVVQVLLNENLMQLTPYRRLLIDGNAGHVTRDMIGEFQRRVLGATHPDRKVDPHGQTIRALRKDMGFTLTEEKLEAIMAGASPARVGRFYKPLVSAMASPDNQINTPLRIAHFLAQLGHESGDLRYTEEIASEAAYEGRIDLGNTEKGDGPRFKGRGLIQVTGRANYTAYGTSRKRDFVTGTNNLLLSENDAIAVDASCWFWTSNGLNTLADADNLRAVTKRINGGFNGLPDRAAHLQRAKCLLVR